MAAVQQDPTALFYAAEEVRDIELSMAHDKLQHRLEAKKAKTTTRASDPSASAPAVEMTAVAAYGKLCEAEGVEYRVYTGDSDDAQKREDFRNPDAAWEDMGCVIFTSALSVAVNPTEVTFGKLFLHTCGTGSTLRDQF